MQARQDPAARTGRGPSPLADLIEVLRGAGLNPALGELADALWLARYARPDVGPQTATAHAADPRAAPPAGADATPGADNTARPGPGDGTEPGADPQDESPSDDGHPQPGDGAARATRVSLYPGTAPPAGARPGAGPRAAFRGPGRRGVPIGVPEAAVLPRLLELQRALRPLQRYRAAAPPLRRVLDEERTADHSARAGGLVIPVFRPVLRGDASLQLLMDASSSMYVWQRMLSELQQVFGQLGAFRDVTVQYLHQAPDGAPAISRRFEPDAAALRSADQLTDPTGRRVTVLVSDCAGPLWRSGEAHRLAYRLLRHAPVAVLQPLPQRLWARTRLPASFGALMHGDGPASSAPLHFISAAGTPAAQGAGSRDDPRRAGAVPVPVLPPAAAALGAWARLLTGTGSGPVEAAVGWVRADQPPAPPARARGPLSATQLVSRFRATASPGAGQLAIYLAAAPLFLPVMQLVQRTMLPDSGPAELSEVLLGGLLRRRDREAGDDSRWYAFADGVQEALLGSLGRDEALLVLKHCSEYVEQRFGKGGPNFPALAIAQLAVADGTRGATANGLPRGDDPEHDAQARPAQPFAEVAARVLERFMPDAPTQGVSLTREEPPRSLAVCQATLLVERFEANGMVQNLLDAVQLLRRAAAQQRSLAQGIDPELWSDLAQNLLRLWRLRGGIDLLREAQDAAQTAASYPGSVPARTVLARVLHAAAGDRRAAGDPRGALDLLRRADREFTAVCASVGLATGEALAVTLDRVRVLEEQWQLGGDSALLEESVGMLEAFADAWPVSRPQPSGLSLARGRALLRLARSAPDRERARTYAQQAATSLERGRTGLTAEGASADARARAALDVVDALLVAGERLERAGAIVADALALAPSRQLRAECLARDARLCVRRYESAGETGGDTAELDAAADRFADASRLLTRDCTGYSDLIAEWGAVLIERADRPGGGAYVSDAVRVLRDCRMETPAGDARLPERLLMLGRALAIRYREAEDMVDLRESEYLFGLAAHSATEPLLRARCWLNLGEAHRSTYRYTRRAERLDQAADAYRRAAEAASASDGGAQGGADRAEGPAAPRGEAARLAATAHHWRGVVYETGQRPRAARAAYQAAIARWRTLPDGGGALAERTAERLADLARVR
ncbi:SAV_2336 N-terminal domain-related protein [Streptomyces zagrosensis]|uniref:Tetratricopeptide (TPR) repeat protein n=1 Tax=Streptomyces zagrosensis TaxID=1042984 RepID=A0A7W9QB55_9ACTN|nr:SAV_2336 N-terminal domain-related protein [Streptomyces zagrosensis]MBB5936920.1 tetratricopeptide (TPR) repeat protein [Streptomyces zagrosensis]